MRRVLRAVPMALLLFAFWLLISADARRWGMVVGAAVSFGVALLASYVIPEHLHAQYTTGFVLRLPVFFVLLLWEIVKANWAVWKIVMAPSLPVSPNITEFDTLLESDAARTILAGSINLTPGTVTLEIDGCRFFVHCLTGKMGEELLAGRLERMVSWLFAEGGDGRRRPW